MLTCGAEMIKRLIIFKVAVTLSFTQPQPRRGRLGVVAYGMKYPVCFLLGLLLFPGHASAQTKATESPPVAPKAGFVPDAATALQIAKAVWRSLYGKQNHGQRRWQAVLKDDSVWVVGSRGTQKGGAYIRMSKRDGRILEATLGK